MVDVPGANATFHYFKDTDKWYASERGVMPEEAFKPFLGHGAFEYKPPQVMTRERILRANGDKYPGLSTTGSNFRCVVIMDDDAEFGWPVMLEPMS